MSADRTGSGEPSRTLALLWGDSQSPRKGPARSVAVDRVVRAALDIADEKGIAGVTVRAVAAHVGIAPMSVYTYVPGKPELLDLMVDALYGEMARPDVGDRPWRERVTEIARGNRELLARHPWLTEVAALSRPPLGPGVMAKYEYELAAFDGTGLSDIDVDASLTYLLGFVQAHCRAAHDAARAVTDTAMSDEQWWSANQPILARALDPLSYPRAVRIGAAAGEAQGGAWGAGRAWAFGLARTLDALAALIEGHAVHD
jgi:AcrR family transcriptional regulator